METQYNTNAGNRLTLFTNIPESLTDFERSTLVPQLVDLFRKTHTQNRVTGRRICEHFAAKGIPVSQQRLCKMVAFIRIGNMISPKALIAGGNGYFISDNPQEVEDQIETFKGRIEAMRAVVDALGAQKLSIERMRLTA